MSRLLTIVLIFAIFISLSTANIINVPQSQPTIQAGIDAALAGDTVLVSENIYYENINFSAKAITVASEFIMDGDTSHISKTIIDGSQSNNPDSGSVVLFVSGEDTNSVLYGFTITGGTGTINPEYDERGGGGIFINSSGGRVSYNKIINNSLTYRGVIGAGIFAGTDENQYVIIEENIIDSNTCITTQSWAEAGGIGIDQGGETHVINNQITNNSLIVQGSGFTLGAGIYSWGGGGFFKGRSLIKGNVIKNNICHPTSVHNWNRGAGVYLEGSSVRLINNEIIRNQFVDNLGRGGGAYIWNSTTEILNNILSENFARDGGGIYLYNCDSVHVINNSIIGNTAERGYGIYIQDSKLFVMNTVLWNDLSIHGNNEIYFSETASIWDMQDINIYNSIVKDDNWGDIDNSVFKLEPLITDSSYHLSDNSPCIGMGCNSINSDGVSYHAPAWDLYGNPRPNAIDTLVDIGAVESPYQSSFVYPKSLSINKSYVEPELDPIQFTSQLHNPEFHSINAFCRITSIDSSVIDSVELYDDGNHNDGQLGDGLYGGALDPVNNENEFHLSFGIRDNDRGNYIIFNDNKQLTSIGPVVFDSYRITPSIFNSFKLKLSLKNEGKITTASNITVEVTTPDTNIIDVTIIDKTPTDIPASQTVEIAQNFTVNIPGSHDTLHFDIKIYSNGYPFWSADFTIDSVTGINKENANIPKSFALSQNYPNPFNPKTIINYELSITIFVDLSIYNVLGQKITTLVAGKQKAGFHSVEWDASGLASGVYYYRLQCEEFVETKKLVLLR